MDNRHNRQYLGIQQSFYEHYEGLHHYAFIILKDNDAAKDAVEKAFSKLWEQWEHIAGEKAVKSHLYTNVYDYCLDVKIHRKIKAQYLSGSAIHYHLGGKKDFFAQA